VSRPLDRWLRRRRARTGHQQDGERLFAGHRGLSREVYVVTRNRMEPLRHRDGTPFNWGVRDAGAVELAAALLHDVGRRAEPDDALELAAEVIADLPCDGFVLSADAVRRWHARRERCAPGDPHSWIAVQCWMFPFAWIIRRPAERSVAARHEPDRR
jgi:hypothetical protein